MIGSVSCLGSRSTFPLVRPLSLGLLACSLFAGLIFGSLCVCPIYAHAGIATDTRIQFWRTLAASIHHVSQLHSNIPLLLAVDSNIWFRFFQIGCLRQVDAPLLPVRRSCSLILWSNPPTHRWGAALERSFSQHQLSHATSLSTLVPIAVTCTSLLPPTTRCVPVISTFPRLLCLRLSPPLHPPCPVCSSLTQIHFDNACLRSRHGSACYLALFARTGSLRDFRRCGSQEARFLLLQQQFHNTIRDSKTHNEWLGSVTTLSRRAQSPVPCCHT